MKMMLATFDQFLYFYHRTYTIIFRPKRLFVTFVYTIQWRRDTDTISFDDETLSSQTIQLQRDIVLERTFEESTFLS